MLNEGKYLMPNKQFKLKIFNKTSVHQLSTRKELHNE